MSDFSFLLYNSVFKKVNSQKINILMFFLTKRELLNVNKEFFLK